VHELIAAPFLGEHFVLRPGVGSGIRLPRASYDELAAAPADAMCLPWLAEDTYLESAMCSCSASDNNPY